MRRDHSFDFPEKFMKQILLTLILVALAATACAPGSPTPTVTLVPVVTRTRTPLAPAASPIIDTPAAPVFHRLRRLPRRRSSHR